MNVQPTGRTGKSAVSQGVVQQLEGTKGWVRFISVLMFVGIGGMLLMAVGTVRMASALNHAMFPKGLGIVFAVIYTEFSRSFTCFPP